jgi:hypothetical protein
MRAEWTAHLTAEDGAAYDAFVARAPSGNAWQTRPWAAVARSGTAIGTRFVTVKDRARLVGVALVSQARVAGVPLPWASIERGPVVEEPSMLGPCLERIERLALAHGILRLQVMPYWSDDAAAAAERDLARRGYKDVQRADGAHARTLRVELPADASALLEGPAMGQIRWRARQAAKAGAVARQARAEDWPCFRAMHSALMASQRRSAFGAERWAALEAFVSDEARGAMFVCEHRGRVVSASVVVRHGRQVTYAWGASASGELGFTKSIPPLVAALRWAQACGSAVFDLGGIPLEGDRDPKRLSIALLKRDFSRRPVRLVRQHARWLVP